MSCSRTTTQWRRWGSNPRPFGLESSTLPLSHCAPCVLGKVRYLIALIPDLCLLHFYEEYKVSILKLNQGRLKQGRAAISAWDTPYWLPNIIKTRRKSTLGLCQRCTSSMCEHNYAKFENEGMKSFWIKDFTQINNVSTPKVVMT